MAYPSAKWRTVDCPTCTAVAGDKCHILGQPKQWLAKPHDGRVRLVDPDNKSLRPQKEDEHGNRIIEYQSIVGKCVVKMAKGKLHTMHAYPEHDPMPISRKIGGTVEVVGEVQIVAVAGLYECRRCGAIVTKPTINQSIEQSK